MRAPPPVEFTTALGRAWRGALSVLVAASVAVPLAWGLPYFAAHWGGLRPDAFSDLLGDPVAQALVAGWVALVAFAAMWLSRRDAVERTLRWDGQEWVLAAEGRPDQRGDAALMLDLGPWMLVRFLPCAGLGGTHWLPLAVAGDLARWAALRGALWNGRGPGAPRP